MLKFRLYRLDKSILPFVEDSIVPLYVDSVYHYDDSVSEEYFKDRLLGKHFSNDSASRVVKDTVIYFKR